MLVVAFALSLVAATSTPPTNPMNLANRADWTDDPSPSGFHPKAICRALGDPQPPLADQPNAAQLRTLGSCDSTKLYYGEGVVRNYTQARECAIPKAASGNRESGGDSLILSELYENGLGVTRDHRLAIAYACQINDTPDDISYLLDLLHPPQRSKSVRVDFCDSATSSQALNYCASLAANLANAKRNARLQALTAHLSLEAKDKFLLMHSAFKTYAQAHSEGESSNYGSLAAKMDTEENQENQNGFEHDLARFLAGSWTRSGSLTRADAQMNLQYRRSIHRASKESYEEFTPAGVRKTQRAWLLYRSAFLGFARAAKPRFPEEAVLTYLTRQRANELKGLTGPF